jgi:hypothetical protein
MDKVNPETMRQIDGISVELLGVQELSANSFEIMGERDFTVNVKIKGRRNEVMNVSKQDIYVTADLGSLKNGIQNVPIKAEVNAEDIFIEEMSRETVTVDIDAIIRKPIDVVIQKEGFVPAGFSEETMQLSLTQVFIKGPETYVNLTDKMLGTININNETSTITKDIALIPVDTSGETISEVEPETNYVTVTVPISKESELPIEPNYEVTMAPDYKLTNVNIEPSTINVRGERVLMEAIKYIDTKLVELKNLKETTKVSVGLNLPEEVSLNQYFDDVEITFVVEPIIVSEFIYDYSDIAITNLNSNYRTNISEFEGQVLLRISAIESIMNDLKKNDLGLVIDAKNIRPGIVTADIVLNNSNVYETVEVLPESIELNIIDIRDEENDEEADTDSEESSEDTTTE